MAFIPYIRPESLPPHERVDDRDHIIQIHSVHPAVMRQHLELYRELMHASGPLTRRERELIAVRVSALNGCRCGVHHHGAGLRRILSAARVAPELQDTLLSGLLSDSPEALDLSHRERALLRYADRLTRQPASISTEDIARLRQAGLEDRAIHDACAIASYFAFVNRIADGLGVELEGETTSDS